MIELVRDTETEIDKEGDRELSPRRRAIEKETEMEAERRSEKAMSSNVCTNSSVHPRRGI